MDTTQRPVRVRFAPSPTGNLHIGGLRTAIFNRLFARHHNGAYLVRIEDTDLERSRQEYVDSILDALRWMNLESDEPLVVQSSRLKEHQHVVTRLIEQGKAYRCFCSSDAVQALKEELLSEGKLLKYDGTCRNKKPSADDLKKPFVIRFKLPYEKGPIEWHDLIRGPLTFDAEQLEDFIIVRSDGMPMYNLVVVIDDAAMNITHIIRGEDHISNTPKQILLNQACGYVLPRYAHIPLILGPSGDRLSKRDGAVSVLDYRANGYLPEALFNYLVRLGWAHGDREMFSRDELVELFTLEAVGKKGSIFDVVKLNWMNGMYMRSSSNDYLLEQIIHSVMPAFEQKIANFTQEQILSLIGLYKERTKTLKELAHELIDLHSPASAFDEITMSSFITPATAGYLAHLIERLRAIDFVATTLSQTAKQLCKELGIKLDVLARPIRLALTGKTESPGVFELLALLKKEESIDRLTRFQQWCRTIHKAG